MEEALSGEAEEKEQVSEEETDLVRNIFSAFTKTIKTFSAYPKDNPIYQKFSSELLEKFDTFFESQESLDIDVDQMSFIYKGQAVFHSDDRQSNMAFLLYVDGIRKISFQRGLTLDEIVDFIDVLRLNPKEEYAEDDIVTLLWEKELEHFSYYVPEQAGYEETAMENELFPDNDEAVGSEAGRAGGAATGAGSGSSGGLAFGNTDTTVTPPGEEEVLKTTEEVSRLIDNDLLTRSVNLFLELMGSEDDTAAIEAISKGIARAIDLMAQKRDLHGMLYILRRLRSQYDSEHVSEAGRTVLDELITKTGSLPNLRLFAEDEGNFEILTDFIGLLSMSAIAQVIELLGETENRKLRKMLCGALVPFAKEDLEPFLPFVGDSRWFLVRNIVTVLGDSKNPAAVGIIEQVTGHNEEKVRIAVLRALRIIGTQDTIQPLKNMVADSSSSIRISALKTLMDLDAPDIYPAILANVRTSDFQRRERVEKKTFLKALGLTGGQEAFSTLAGIFRKRRFFNREENAELKAYAALGLGHTGSPEAIDLLKKGAKSRNPTIRQACAQALEKAGVNGEN